MPWAWILFMRAASAACLTTSGDALTAGDLARVLPVFAALPAATVLGWAPAPGVERVIEGQDLWRLARRYALDLPAPPQRLCVRQPIVAVGRSAFEAALREAAAEEWRIELEEWSRAALPPGRLSFDVRAVPRLPRAAGIRAVLWRGVLVTEAGRRYPVWARVRLSLERQRLQARGAIGAGESVEAGTVVLATASEYPLWPLACQSLAETAGQQARRRLMPGEAIGPRDLTPAPAVRRGEALAIEVATGNTRLQIRAQAEAPARAGQVVLVKNPLNGRRFQARVTAPGRAEAITSLNVPPAGAATGVALVSN